ncbi:MAG: MaoC family dehydratase N-terminal domain-containing protein [Sphingomonadales bacterium]|nr:MaoC family dehydratase N-terminal domain-containing protein [Sphingomonadales bacterium]
MPANLDSMLGRSAEVAPFDYEERDALLYALSIGMGQDPLDPAELAFVLEKPALRVVPTLASVLGAHAHEAGLLWQGGLLDPASIVHGEERLELHRPLPAAGTLAGRKHVCDVVDKGAGRGAIITVRKELHLGDGIPAITCDQRIFVRGGGGFGGGPGSFTDLKPVPNRPADAMIHAQTRPEQALLYRLNGDRHLLHADPDFARRAGFERPILHGLCTYGIACRAVLAEACGHDPSRLRRFAARMSAPVYPGDTLATEVWRDGDQIAFRTTVPARGVTVLDCGAATIGPGRAFAPWSPQDACAGAGQYASRKAFLYSLPVGSRGSASVKSTLRGVNWRPSRASTNARISAASSGEGAIPGAGSTTAFTSSPSSSLGTPITATSATLGCSASTSSICCG